MGLILWLLQRITAICMPLYAFIAYMYFSQEPINYIYFQKFFSTGLFPALFITLVFSMSVHAFIGIWTISTDYLKCRTLRYSVLSLYAIVLLLTVCEAIFISTRGVS
jgi:succinate dehydrogenase / fumarate reductase membrane anchor subunit